MKILLAVMTCHARRAWVQAQRETWVPALRAQGIDVRFFYGAPPSGPQFGVMQDEEWLHDVRDDYLGIPLKVQRICAYAVLHEYDYVAKLDDDVYVVPDRFRNLKFVGYDYVGRFRGPYGKVYPAHFASGFFYWLSYRAAAWVAGTHWNRDWMDERFVANTLAMWNVFGYNDPANYLVTGPFTSPNVIIDRALLRDGAVFCEYGPKELYEMHAVFSKCRPIVTPHPGLKEVPKAKVTEEILYAPCGDQPPERKVSNLRWKERLQLLH